MAESIKDNIKEDENEKVYSESMCFVDVIAVYCLYAARIR